MASSPLPPDESLSPPMTERVPSPPGLARASDESNDDAWARGRPAVDSSEFRQFLNFVEARARADRDPMNVPETMAKRRFRDDRDSGDEERSNAGPPPSFDGTGSFKDFFLEQSFGCQRQSPNHELVVLCF